MQPVPFFYFLRLVFDDVGMLMFLEEKKKHRLLHLFSTDVDILYCTITCCFYSPVLCWNFKTISARNRVGLGLSYGPPGYICWRNPFLGINFLAPKKFQNSASAQQQTRVEWARNRLQEQSLELSSQAT